MLWRHRMNSIVKEENIYIDIEVNDFEELIKKISQPLIEAGDVTEEFPTQVIKREANFPTGLPAQYCGVAIPHTDPEYVNENRVVVATLKKPVEVEVMGGDGETVQASIVFLLALGQSNKHLNILQKLIQVIQNKELVEKIREGNEKEIYGVVSNIVDK